MKLRLPPPPDRTAAQLAHHFAVERRIAERLKRADRIARAQIYGSMYDELFALVPDHPRLTRRADPRRTAEANRIKLSLLTRFLRADATVMEVGCGDCTFAYELCSRVRHVYGVDISDQRAAGEDAPGNFELVLYDGYTPPLPLQSIDVAFSDQLLEHLHPDDVGMHLNLVHELLRPGGVYVLRTPHALCGPHDVSMYFCDEPRGFHLKEWTYGQLARALREVGFVQVRAFRFIKGRAVRVPCVFPTAIETSLSVMPPSWHRKPARWLLPEVCMAAVKRPTGADWTSTP